MVEAPPESSDNTTFTDAVDALRHGNKTRARDLLTALLKDDQNSATYWIWLSAAVDNPKERVYCLQTALKLEPENGTARRGLVLLGALTPDETVQPFPMNRPRAWEEKLLLANEKPKERGLKVIARSPAARLMGTLLVGVGLCAAVVFGFILPNRNLAGPTSTNTPGPSPTFTFTPTVFGATAAPTTTYIGPTPLWMLLPSTYTPTPLYVSTPRDPLNFDQARTAQEAYKKGDWDGFIQNMRLIARAEPNSADVYYYIGEAYRFKGDASSALDAYNDALRIDPDFGPPYLGLARARLIQDPNVNIEYLFDEAIARDGSFGEVYLERARYYIRKNDPEAAIVDLNRADQLIPGSPEVFLAYANAYLALDDEKNALASAEEAYALDMTNLAIYSLLGELYINDGQYQRGVEALEVYVVYEDENAFAFALLGRAYYGLGNYRTAIEKLDTAFSLNPNGSRRFYVYRGLAHLELDNVDQAVQDLEKAFEVDRSSFDVNLGLVKAYFIQEKFGYAFLKVEGLQSIVETDDQIAQMLYWRALIQEKRGELTDAVRTWQDLLAVGEDVLSPEMRQEAEQHLKAVITPTNTPKTGTPTPTGKPKSVTTSPTPQGARTPTPTRTPLP
jgi:tetratricopeptide (TPR) repeat protein